MPLQIPSNDRIVNYWDYIGGNPPEDFDPTLPYYVNADWIMKMLDKLVNGQYATKSFQIVASINNLPTNAESGQTAYVMDNEHKDGFFIYNGTEWKNIYSEIPDGYITGEKIAENTIPQSKVIDLSIDLDNKANTALTNLTQGLSNTICTTQATTTSSASRNIPAAIIENYYDGTTGNWYRIWSDGWVEQGGRVTTSVSSNQVSTATVNFHVPFEDGNYFFTTENTGALDSDTNSIYVAGRYGTKHTTYVNILSKYVAGSSTGSAGSVSYYWFACGYKGE